MGAATSVDVKHRTRATATGGRDGRAVSEDGAVEVNLVVPRELGGPGGAGRRGRPVQPLTAPSEILRTT